jgi:hypothetical protein
VTQSAGVGETIAGIGYDPATLKFKGVGTDPTDIDACYFVTHDATAILVFRGTLPPTWSTRSSKLFFQVLSDWLNDGDGSADAAGLGDPVQCSMTKDRTV